MTNHANNTPHFWVVDDPEMFFPRDVTIAETYNCWDNGYPIDDDSGKRYKPSGPPWFYPSTRLALQQDLFRDEDLRLFILRAKLESGRTLDRRSKLFRSRSDVVKFANQQYDGVVEHGINRAEWISFQVAAWSEAVEEERAIAEMVLQFISAIDAVLSIRLAHPSKVIPPIRCSIDCLCCWWRDRGYRVAKHAPGSQLGLISWLQSNQQQVVTKTSGLPFTAEDIRKKFNTELEPETISGYKSRFAELDELFALNS